MNVGYIPMNADLLHIGHLRAIRQARKNCKYLIIGLLDCSKYKKTIIPYKQREELLKALPEVNEVRRQTSLSMNLNGVDVVFSGDGFEPQELKAIKKYNCNIVHLKYCGLTSTTKIKQKIWQHFQTQPLKRG
jgi:cytidyltransferase-like protein